MTDRVDIDLDSYLDDTLGSTDPEGSSRDETEIPDEPVKPTEKSFFDDENDELEDLDDEDNGEDEDDDEDDEYEGSSEEDDEDDDEDDEDDGDEDALDPVAQRAAIQDARLKAVATAVQEKQAEAAANIRRAQTAMTLQQLKAQATPEEWEQIQTKLMDGWKAHQQQQAALSHQKRDVVIAAYQMRDKLIREQAEEDAGRAMAIQHVEDTLGKLSESERMALENASHENFVPTFKRIQAARANQTEPARKVLRERRQAKKSDRAPLRETNGSRTVRGDYGNYSMDNFDEYFDDHVFGT